MKRIYESDQFTGQRVAPAAVEVNIHSGGEDGADNSGNTIDIKEKQGVWTMFFRALNNWHERRQTVKILRGLNSSQLKDIGLSCVDVDKLYGNRDDNRKVWPNWPK
ncbi:DUF1127 domain-containing protein [Rouxiella silvae]|uniref:DUF1127 domain-containing protein n=1 Tax=Rouxiella silvae TaxID=1646373 RepID=A0AA40X3J2_9GAMM|nr:DUF1127 domain-containing protein [Rouxiella silvae]MBF6638051.1 DUF1127 domain-containing protein [Rouxiella silvae]